MTQLRKLRAHIAELPRSTAQPPIDHTVYVSFVDKNGWRSETYDSEQLPEPFESVVEILGERFETRDRKSLRPK